MKTSPSVQAQIEQDMLGRFTTRALGRQANLYLYDEVLETGETLKAAGLEVGIPRPTAFAFADLAPLCNWAHPCEYCLYDAETGRRYDSVDAALPPPQMVLNPGGVRAISAAVHLPDMQKARALRRAAVPPLTRALSAAPGQRYAILFAGHAENRHTNDLEFLYRTLVNVYGFNTANIHVLNHDGTVNYYGASSPVGNWPGNNTAYQMNVTGAGTRAGMQAALRAIAAQIRREDFLFIHTNNHGGGECDPGVTDYCMFVYDANADWVSYYVDDFITDLRVLPNFEVLMVMMEQCRAGGFIEPIIDNSPATWTWVDTAVVADDYSLAGANFDPYAEDWIAAIAGSYPDGSGLSQTVDTNNDGRISAAEAFAYALAVRTLNGGVHRWCNGRPLRLGDTPTSSVSPTGQGAYIFLGLPAHDLYLRDNLQDHGREPLIGGGISCSPDIIIYNQELLDPEATLATAAAQGSDTLGEAVEFGQDNFIYLRVQNRGRQVTSGQAKVYWTLPSTLPTPTSWHLIGGPINIPAVNPNEMKVVGPLTWSKNDIPAKGHYCFVGLIESGSDPAPDPATIHTVDDYYRFIRESNNATWKNFNVVDTFKNATSNMTFQIQGWPKVQLSADLMLDVSQLPASVELTLKILKRLSAPASRENMQLVEESQLYQKFSLHGGMPACLRHIDLRASDSTQAYLEVTVPRDVADGNYRFAVAEIVDGKEMGRVTQMLAVGDYPFMANRNTKEIHNALCQWAALIARSNKVAYHSVEQAIKHGYNGCRYCLPQFSTD